MFRFVMRQAIKDIFRVKQYDDSCDHVTLFARPSQLSDEKFHEQNNVYLGQLNVGPLTMICKAYIKSRKYLSAEAKAGRMKTDTPHHDDSTYLSRKELLRYPTPMHFLKMHGLAACDKRFSASQEKPRAKL